jgi:hypothetical protein
MEIKEMETLIKEAISNGNMEPNRLYDTGLQFVVPVQVGGGITFMWFDNAYDISDYVSC